MRFVNLMLSFSWVGILVFILPLPVNLFYVLFPSTREKTPPKKGLRWVEIVEGVSRIAYLVLLTVFESRNPLHFQSAWFFLAVLFLALYHVVWIRYFAGGRKVALLEKPFWFVPIPLAVFPVFIIYLPLFGWETFRRR